jgi:hypothetical protein
MSDNDASTHQRRAVDKTANPENTDAHEEFSPEMTTSAISAPPIRRKVLGTIVQSRCLGKHLAFAQIQEDKDADGNKSSLEHLTSGPREPATETRRIAVKFYRPSFDAYAQSQELTAGEEPYMEQMGDPGLEPFPTKKTSLPCGTKVETMVELKKSNGNEMNVKKWEVLWWRKLYDPITEAKLVATQNIQDTATTDAEDGGISCSEYLKFRGDLFLHFNNDCAARPPKVKSKHDLRGVESDALTKTSEINDNDNHHKFHKALRAKIFASWLMENVLGMTTQQRTQSQPESVGIDVKSLSSIHPHSHSHRVLDIAGGKGLLSMELAMQGVRCTVIDPLIRKKPNTKRLRKLGAPIPNFVAQPFTTKFEFENHPNCDNTTCVVGLHPDEATEDILDVALRMGDVSVAIVPCCVFPSFFPMRQLHGGGFVNTHEEFCQYLLEKDPRLQRATLPFEGKNEVIYLNI